MQKLAEWVPPLGCLVAAAVSEVVFTHLQPDHPWRRPIVNTLALAGIGLTSAQAINRICFWQLRNSDQCELYFDRTPWAGEARDLQQGTHTLMIVDCRMRFSGKLVPASERTEAGLQIHSNASLNIFHVLDDTMIILCNDVGDSMNYAADGYYLFRDEENATRGLLFFKSGTMISFERVECADDGVETAETNV